MEELLNDEIPSIDIELTSVTVDAKVRKLRTVKDFNPGMWKRPILYFYWFFHRNGKTFKEYLDSPIKWTYELPNEIEAYYDMDAGEELEELLEEQIRRLEN